MSSSDTQAQRPGGDRYAAFLRTAGLGAIALAAVVSMLQGFADLAPLGRFSSLLGVTLALGLSGWACIRRLRDQRTARLCLGLVMAMLPVLMSQVGGMVHASLNTGAVELPRAMAFAGMSGLQALAAAVASLVLVSPFLYLGFALVERQGAVALTIAYVASSLAMVLPLRQIPVTLALVALGTAVAHLKSASVERTAGHGKIREAAVTELLFLLMPTIVAARGGFYPDGDLALSALCALLGYASLRVVPRLVASAAARDAARVVGALFIAGGWLGAAAEIISELRLPSLGGAALVSLPLVTLFHSLALRTTAQQGFFRALGTASGALGLATVVLDGQGLAGALGTSVLGLALAALGHALRERSLLRLGLAGLALGLVWSGAHVVDSTNIGSWVVIAALGIGCFLLAAYRERTAGAEHAKDMSSRS